MRHVAGKADACRGRQKHKATRMKPSIHKPRSRGFTLIELLVVITIIAIIASLAGPAFAGFLRRGRMTAQVANGTQIYKAMRNYASEIANNGQFPTYIEPEDPSTLVNSSNQAFEILLPRYLDSKGIFVNK